MPADTFKQIDTTCTTINDDNKEYIPPHVKLPEGTYGYIEEKALVGLQYSKIISFKDKKGATQKRRLMQVTMAAAIAVDEWLEHYCWKYKAEVSFDMRGATFSLPPKPFLTRDKTGDPDAPEEEVGNNRRQSTNPVPLGRNQKPGEVRRADIIIVKKKEDRWPGKGNIDHNGGKHVPNLERLVEVKFPGDNFGKDQENACNLIAGNANCVTVVDISDCNHDLDRNPLPWPVPFRVPNRRTIRKVTIPKYQPWVAKGATIPSFWDEARQGVEEWWKETQNKIKEVAAWLFTVGQWTHDEAGKIWTYIDKDGKIIFHYTIEEIREGWKIIKRQTDLTWQQLKQIQWGNILMTIIEGVVVCLLIIAGIAVVLLLAIFAVAILGFLLGIIAGAALETAEALAAATLIFRNLGEQPIFNY